MLGLDGAIAGLGDGGILLALGLAVLLGLRHATDPDHLTAVSTLVMSGGRAGARRARVLGLAWGLGHGIALFAFGLPVVLVGDELPARVQQGLEVAIGGVIVALAVRLLVRWRRGYFHAHPHRHGDRRHSHPHVHEHAGSAAHPHEHDHPHAEALGRSPLAGFGIGLLHGAGGSAGASILLVAGVSGDVSRIAVLALFAVATAVSMAAISGAFGSMLAREPVTHRLAAAVPAFGALSLLFGVWYALGALETVPYAF